MWGSDDLAGRRGGSRSLQGQHLRLAKSDTVEEGGSASYPGPPPYSQRPRIVPQGASENSPDVRRGA